jgi:hypothetical protein
MRQIRPKLEQTNNSGGLPGANILLREEPDDEDEDEDTDDDNGENDAEEDDDGYSE